MCPHLCFSCQSPLHLVGQQFPLKLLMLQLVPGQRQLLLRQLKRQVSRGRRRHWWEGPNTVNISSTAAVTSTHLSCSVSIVLCGLASLGAVHTAACRGSCSGCSTILSYGLRPQTKADCTERTGIYWRTSSWTNHTRTHTRMHKKHTHTQTSGL